MIGQRRNGFISASVAIAVGVTIACGSLPARAQHAAKPRKKPAATTKTDPNRLVRDDLGISFVVPDGYIDNAPRSAVLMRMEGPRTTSTTGLANYRSENYRVSVLGYIRTAISLVRQPDSSRATPAFPYTTESAKSLLDTLNKSGINGGDPLNYQNSAKIQVAGHDALAVLAEASVPGLTDRGMVRLLLMRHRGRLYVFEFQAVDVEFETRVPSFEKFMSSVKFLQPDVEPPANAAPTGPISITISK